MQQDSLHSTRQLLYGQRHQRGQQHQLNQSGQRHHPHQFGQHPSTVHRVCGAVRSRILSGGCHDVFQDSVML